MVVDAFGRLNAAVSEPVPDVVERIPVLDVHHPISDAVAKCVRGHVARIAARSVDLPGTDVSDLGDIVEHIADALFGNPVGLPRGKQGVGVLPAVDEVGAQQPDVT